MSGGRATAMAHSAIAPLPHVQTAEEFGRAFAVSRETLDRLVIYADMLKLWQKTINLIAPGTVDDIWHRHMADSAQLMALAPSAALRWVDLGSGGGFPGLVLGIMLAERPGARMTLVESDGRKSAFLREVARSTRAPVDILCNRIEQAATHARFDSVDVVSARALAALDRLVGLARPLFGPATVGLFPKGRDAEAEVAAALRTWSFTPELVPSRTDNDGRIVVVRELKR